MINELLLLSGNDIPFEDAQIIIHPPTLKEIAYIGEEAFFVGCELLKFSKDILTDEDKSHLVDQSNFDILMLIMNEQNGAMQYNIECFLKVLILLFPSYDINFDFNEGIILTSHDDFENHYINNSNFENFKKHIVALLSLDSFNGKEQGAYNPNGELAQKIANKFKKRHQELAKQKNAPNKVAVFSRYISILSVGEQKDINSFMHYTIYQLLDEFHRFELKANYDTYIKFKMAGAKDLKDPEDWMKDIHE